MNLLGRNYIPFLMAGAIILNGCNKAYTPEVSVTPSPLEVHGDSVAFDVSGTLPVKKLKKKRVYKIDGEYVYGDQSVKIASMEYKGTDFPDAKTTAPVMQKHFSFEYKPEIANGELKATGTNYNATLSKGKASESLVIAKGLITTSRLVQDYYHIVYADHGYNDQEELVPTTVAFFFDQGKSKLKTTQSKGSNGKFLDAFIAQKNVTRTVSIVGTHSPEGTEAKNSKLADDRAAVIESYYKGRMSHFNQKEQIDSIKFVKKGIVLDWEPLRAELANDSTNILSADQKSEILNVINGAGSFDDKQKSLEKLSSYKTLFNKIYPKLRKAQTEILTVKKKKSRAEIALLAKGIVDGKLSMDTLSKEEMLYASHITPILKEKESILTAAVKKGDDFATYNNLGAVYLAMAAKEIDDNNKLALVDKAVNNLNMSIKVKDNAEAHANLAVAHMMKQVRTDVAAEVQKAKDLQPSNDLLKGLNGMQGVVDIKEGKYEPAVNSLSKSSDSTVVLYNLALANLLKKDFNAAKAGFATVTSKAPNYALGFYLAAVTGARMGDETQVVANLKKAVELNRELAGKATNDMEFVSFWNSDNFKNALK